MNPALEKITKYLQLEAERGYDNRAVVGGLQRMLEPWRTEAEDTGLDEQLIEVVESRLRDYPKLSPTSRAEALEGLWNRLRKELPDAPETLRPLPDRERKMDDLQPPRESEAQTELATSEPAAAIEREPESEREKEREKPKEPTGPPISLDSELTAIKGIGPKSARTLKKLDLESLSDLLWHLPRRYDDYSQLKTINRLWFGEDVTIIGTIEKINVRDVRNGTMKLTEAVIGDGTGNLRVTWFNQPWIANRLREGKAVVLSGSIDQYLGRLTMNNPEWELLERKQLHTNRIVPVYPLTAGISGKWLRRVIHSVVSRLANRVADPLPKSVIESASLMPLSQALQQVHFPDNWEMLEEAQHRLAFEEMFLLQLGVLRQKQEWEALSCPPLAVEETWVERFLNALPYHLTNAQQEAVKDIREDLKQDRPMNRLLQGDVGSGKTVVAAFAIGVAAENDAQSAIMAPTSILAEQHCATLFDLLTKNGTMEPESVRLLIGATSGAEKEEIRTGLADGSIKLVVGTHALLEDPINFQRLGLVIIDEQHRFGVEQRATLRAKGENPNLLVMTATPIPRSLALTVYGDLDLSIIDEMPPGRQVVETRVLRPRERARVHQFVLNQLEKGRQAYLIYPLVEGSEKVQAKAAVDEYERLKNEIFFQYRVGLLHGRIPPDEKEEVMSKFRTGELDVLVSTSVVEVGVDVPNATVMLVEGADRFGLAQLHQLRGRVGRGEHQSYCLLIPGSDEASDNERLAAMESTTDGFRLAELDLQQRGPGDFLGTRQSGFEELRTAQLTDVRLIEKARKEAKRLFQRDPELQASEYQPLNQALLRFWADGKGEIS
jgi:ATP-dependent DNA helicase RecG